jgi:hypothetical protein
MDMNNENHGVEAEGQEELVSYHGVEAEGQEELVSYVEFFQNSTYVLVEFTQLLKLLQRCTECGKLPERKSRGKPRKIEWTKSGRPLFHKKEYRLYRNEPNSRNAVRVHAWQRSNKMGNSRVYTRYRTANM